MALLRNNNVYIWHVLPLQVWWQQYQDYQYQSSPYRGVFTSYGSTFQDDLRRALNYFNGLLHRCDLEQYIESTVCNFDTSHTDDLTIDYHAYFVDLRYQFFERFLDMLFEHCNSVFPGLPGLPSQDIYLAHEKAHLFILDRRRETYAPNELYTVVRRFDNGSPLNDDGRVF